MNKLTNLLIQTQLQTNCHQHHTHRHNPHSNLVNWYI